MGQWTKEHLLDAWQHYESVVERCGKSNDWNDYADLFTEDGRYVDDVDPDRNSREEIRDWITGIYTNPVARAVRTFVTKWFIVDEERGWVIAEFDNIWDDPGNGQVFSFRNYTLMKYAGDYQWCFQEDQYNPQKRMEAGMGWMQARQAVKKSVKETV